MYHSTFERVAGAPAVQKAACRFNRPHFARRWGLAVLTLTLTLGSLQAQRFTPPPAPAIAPLIGQAYGTDADSDRIDDELKAQAQDAVFSMAMAPLMDGLQRAQAALEEKVNVELIFKAPVTQAQIDTFLAVGGEIKHMYRAVSYGWTGRLPLDQVEALPSLMGAQLVLVAQPKPIQATLDKATVTGRARPVWAPGFAGNPAGFDGDPSITIAVLDTGVDGSHTDLAGRMADWWDYTDEGLTTPLDFGHHGSHVMGIALGSGASSGSGTSTLSWSEFGWLRPFYNAVTGRIDLPATPVVFSSFVQWDGDRVHPFLFGAPKPGNSGSFSMDYGPIMSPPFSGSTSLVGDPGLAYYLLLSSEGGGGYYSIVNSVTNYPGHGDGFNKLRGVAPGCMWGGERVLDSTGHGTTEWLDAALDDMVYLRSQLNVKVLNMSLGYGGAPGLVPSTRQKVNTAVNNGIVVAIAAGNDGAYGTTGEYQVDDPGRAALALTVAASDDNNQLTHYSSVGFSPNSRVPVGQEEDYKPDLMAPGGSNAYYTPIMSIDSNTDDGEAFSDQQPNDYTQMNGTSMATPFVAGCAALVIDAMQQKGITWDFASSAQPRYVKMVLCATASESNAPREDNYTNPTLQRAASGPNYYPAGKDLAEGYGMINPDAAVEAVSQTYTVGSSASCALGSGVGDKRVWARNVSLSSAGEPVYFSMTPPSTGDYDMYLYSSTPAKYGAPVILASSTNAGNGVAEAFAYKSSTDQTAILVVKRVSGYGSFDLSSAFVPTVQFSQSASSGSEATASVSVTATLSRTSPVPVSVSYSFSGTATNGTDYTASSNVISFAPGQTSQVIPITVVNDTVYEGNETVFFVLNSATWAMVASPSQHTYTILENDRPKNDLPGGAQVVKPMSNPSNSVPINGQLMLNSQTSNFTPTCNAGAWPDIWYQVPVFVGQILTVTNLTPTSGSVALWTGGTARYLTQQACTVHNLGAPENSVTYQAGPGIDKIWVQYSSADTNCMVSLVFHLYQNCYEPGTTKDVCSYAQTLSCGSGAIIGPLTVGATAGSGQPNGLSVPDVWYQITPADYAPGLTISFADQGTSSDSGFIAVYRGGCDHLMLRDYKTTRDAQGKFSIIGFKAGQGDPLYIRIGSSSTATNQQLQVSCFDKTNP